MYLNIQIMKIENSAMHPDLTGFKNLSGLSCINLTGSIEFGSRFFKEFIK